jgi:GGDEF domain-containing protein
VHVGGHEIQLGVSVGLVYAEPGNLDADRLPNRADEAMYRVKRRHGGVARRRPAQ